VKTPDSRSKALLWRVTRADHFWGDFFAMRNDRAALDEARGQ
jgi:hypothetical protein